MYSPSEALSDTRILLLQARPQLDMFHQERTCFLERCRVTEEQLISVNLPEEDCSRSFLDGTDAILIGGAGSISALDDLEWTPGFHDFLYTAINRNVPIFGCCWGHQVIARVMGGEVIHDSPKAELGCREMHLTPEGEEDPLFSALPRSFRANTGHHDRVVDLPEGAVELVYNDSQRNQAFRLRDKPVYGTQFHTELDARRERERLITYRDYYRRDLPSNEAFQAVLDSLEDTPHVDNLLYEFLVSHCAPTEPA